MQVLSASMQGLLPIISLACHPCRPDPEDFQLPDVQHGLRDTAFKARHAGSDKLKELGRASTARAYPQEPGRDLSLLGMAASFASPRRQQIRDEVGTAHISHLAKCNSHAFLSSCASSPHHSQSSLRYTDGQRCVFPPTGLYSLGAWANMLLQVATDEMKAYMHRRKHFAAASTAGLLAAGQAPRHAASHRMGTHGHVNDDGCDLADQHAAPERASSQWYVLFAGAPIHQYCSCRYLEIFEMHT